VFIEGVVLLIIVIRLFNFDFLVRFSTFFTLMSVIPAILYIGFAMQHVQPSAWLDTSGKQNCTDPVNFNGPEVCQSVPVEWGRLLPFTMWLWSGFFSLSSLAGEVKNPGRNIPIATAILIPFVALEIVFPLALSISIDEDQSNYVSGYYAELAYQVAGLWLKIVFTIVAITSLVGTCNGAVIVSDEALQSFCVRHYESFFVRQGHSSSRVLRWLFDVDNRIAPFFALLNGFILAGAVWLPYELLISASMVLANFTLFLLFASYVILKRREPKSEWMYKFHWGYSVVLITLPAAFTGVMSYYVLFDYPVSMGIPYFNLICTAVVVSIGLAIHGVYVWSQSCTLKPETLSDASSWSSHDAESRVGERQPLIQ
jgi:amino acid transporter